ncbi:MAG: hypothetical protein COT73_04330 [Bdellovibrio sp. CG10_big_fil_rev_8_21_14_0_10_47_8]|nr:MAG: hypothetical protein COT73_04330 [Bdellovibrio sp. CG10_big_fil_rev_8_21_14_0_10_47_8]
MNNRLTVLVGFLLSSSLCWAAPSFTSIDQASFDKISKEFSANFMHHSVQGAAPLGNIFGFELGILAGQTATPDTKDIVASSGGSDLDKIYHGGILAAVSVPLGISGELVYFPKTTASGVSLESTSLAAKLSLNTELLKMIPFNLALRAFYTDSKLSFDQQVGAVSSTVTDTDKVTGFQLLLSPAMPVIEPYAGLGIVSAKNTLSTTGGSIFSSGLTTGSSFDGSYNSTQLLAGITARLVFVSLGLEYSNAFGASSYTAKLAASF